jgi:rod shape-determining protein MreC
MFTRLFYLLVVVAAGVTSIMACRLVQAPLADIGSSWFTGPLQVVTGAPASAFGDVIANIQNIGDLRRENQRLRAEIEQLRQDNVSLPELQRENQRLREQLALRQALPSFRWAEGRVIGYDATNTVRSMIINAGSRDGISEGLIVISAQGIVGRVVRASPTTSKILLITDGSSSINAVVQSSRARGVLNGGADGELTMRYIAKGEQVRTGDRIVTSGLGGVYPEGLLIGTVIDVRQRDVDMFQDARVEPAVDFARLETALVVTNYVPAKLD